MALFDRQCWWRDAVIEALEAGGRSYRIVFSSESVAGVKAAIGTGLAVGMLAASAQEPSMRILGDADGLPPLPPSSMELLTNESNRSDLLKAMVAALLQAALPHNPSLQT